MKLLILFILAMLAWFVASPTALAQPPCGAEDACLATVVAQLATIVAKQAEPVATPNVFTKSLPSGHSLTIAREYSYGDVAISTSAITLLLVSIIFMVWQGVKS